jgi:hypothetical protein
MFRFSQPTALALIEKYQPAILVNVTSVEAFLNSAPLSEDNNNELPGCTAALPKGGAN